MPTVWPTSLPKVPLREGAREALGDGRVRTAMDAGPAKVRRRFTAAPSSFSFPTVLTGTQLSTFLTFWNTTTLGGSLPFEFTHPRTNTTVSARFGPEPPAWEQVDVDRYLITVGLELLP